METTCRLFKLRSGEEVLGLLSGESDSTISILKPMVIKTHISPDSLGVTREITILRNWLEFTDQEYIDLPKDHVASVLMPSESTVFLYQKSVRTEENYKETLKQAEEKKKEVEQNPDSLQDMFKSLFDDIIEMDSNEPPITNPLAKPPSPMPFPFMNPNTNVGMFFSIPPDVFQDMIENGLLDFDMFGSLQDDEEDEDILIPEMEFLTDKEKEKMRRKGINLEDFPDDPRKYIDDISEDTKE
jgi:hypothetical protein